MHCTHVHQPGSPEERPLFLPEVGSRSRSGAGERGHRARRGDGRALHRTLFRPLSARSRRVQNIAPNLPVAASRKQVGTTSSGARDHSVRSSGGQSVRLWGDQQPPSSNGTVPDAGCRRRCRCSLVEPHAPLQKADANRLGRQPVSPRTERVSWGLRASSVRFEGSRTLYVAHTTDAMARACNRFRCLLPMNPPKYRLFGAGGVRSGFEGLHPSGRAQNRPWRTLPGAVLSFRGLPSRTPRHRHTGTALRQG